MRYRLFAVTLALLALLALCACGVPEASAAASATSTGSAAPAPPLEASSPASETSSTPVYDPDAPLSERLEYTLAGDGFYVLLDGKPVSETLYPPCDAFYFEPIILLDADTALLNCRYIYRAGDTAAKELELPLDYVFCASVSPDRSRVAYIAKNSDSSAIVAGYYDFSADSFTEIERIDYDAFPSPGEVKLYIAWGGDGALYFDEPQNRRPAISRYDIASGTLETVRTNSRRPVAGSDGKLISWIEQDVYHGSGKIAPVTVISNGRAEIRRDGVRAVKISGGMAYSFAYSGSVSGADLIDMETLESAGVIAAGELPPEIASTMLIK